MLPLRENAAQNATHESSATLPIDAVAASTAPYEYQPLDPGKKQIRLLRIIPGGTDESVHCTLSIFRLNFRSPDKQKFRKRGREGVASLYSGKWAPRYLALSYTWGAPTPIYNIFVNGKSFQVRENLYHFLADFRGNQEDEYLWIDQICIDQSSLGERSSQVRNMEQIYSCSDSVIVWLGDNSEGLQNAARHLANVNVDLGSPTSSDWNCLICLLENRYFTRLWIVQEVVLAPKIRVLVRNRIWVSWEKIMWIFTEGIESGRSRDSVPTGAHSVLEFHTLDLYRRYLTMLLVGLRENQCEEPRDRLYALMAIVREEERLPVDYSKPITEVFLDALAVCFGSNDQISDDEGSLLNLGRSMGFDEHMLQGLKLFLQAIFNRWALTPKTLATKILIEKVDVTLVGYESPGARIQGLDVQDKTRKQLPGRWWFEYNERRIYYDCGVPDKDIEVRDLGNPRVDISVEKKVRSRGGLIYLEPQDGDDTLLDRPCYTDPRYTDPQYFA